ncbi:lipopolysaccharide biosynthesis protein [Hymenobacter sp. GOD-10R]|uniref:lipopolysaccharide biosynthesis protein n=1 Tax=Hymenobacter sp. GOD-10R TaxID=3093922 RepID=UPI002D77AD6C|nr:polysaccharide biosynthesis C-terminal domain-containing protein [Hymenobacter sp. GOD-10R]WRQ29213.1 polysaccharide biosynthesis C-terminal domain-containing protein [Hymenobacter sp. GOD-10R]
MVRRILQNFVTRFATALFSFAIVWFTARYLGASGRGAVSLFTTDCAALLLFIGLVGGSSLIYLSPKRSIWHLLPPAYAWAIVVCAVGTLTVGLLRQVSITYLGHLCALSLLQAFFTINTLLLLGRKQEKAYNVLTVLQVTLLAGFLLVAFAGLAWREVSVYYYASYVAYGLPLLLSFVVLARLPDQWNGGKALRETTRELAQNGRGAHLSNILAFANYRLSYYFVAHYVDAHAVGILSVGVALAEAVWLIPRSTALVQYVDLVHATDKQAQVAPALGVARLSLLATGIGVLTLSLLPSSVFVAVFGPEFGAARSVIILLAPGVMAIASNIMCSTYFSGLGQYRVNNISTALGLIVTVPACWLLIPQLGIQGAALASSLSYLASMAYLLRAFSQATNTGMTALLPSRTDLQRVTS